MFPFLVIAFHSERDSPEVNERRCNGDVGDSKDDPPRFGTEIAREVVEEEALGKDGKVQCWKVMMNVQHTKFQMRFCREGRGLPAHDEEGNVMQCPADEGVQAGVVDMVEVGWCKIDIMPLPTEEVNETDDGEDNNARGRRPNVDGIAEKEVFDS
jgi:hypothetical protein